MRIVLASASPRRAQLLSRLFKNFSVEPSDINEGSIHRRARAAVDVAKMKARAAQTASRDEKTIVIAADTAVWLGKKQFGKPKDEEDAKSMLCELSGKRHTVFTGVCVAFCGREYSFFEKSRVLFKTLDEAAAKDYIKKYKPLDKAGAYGVQDNEIVESFRGSYTNIMGLPLEKLEKLLKRLQKKYGTKILE